LATLTVQNRGGLAQRPLLIEAVSLNELPYGYITTVAGGSTFTGDGSAANTVPILPVGVTVDAGGNLLVVDSLKSGIRRINAASGIVTTVAGNGNTNSSGDGGLAIVASLSPPGTGSSNFVVGVAFDAGGNFYVTDGDSVRKVNTATGIITTVAGGDYGFGGDGSDATKARFNYPNGIAIDGAGNLFIADTFNHRIRKVDATNGIITTVAGSGPDGEDKGSFSGDNLLATSATLNSPVAVAVDSTGNLYISDVGNRRIRKVSVATGIISTIAGIGTSGTGKLGDNGPATAAEVAPLGITLDAADNLILVDGGSDRVRKIDGATQVITTIAGNGELGSSGDGGPATSASLFNPNSVSVDAAGNVFVADTFNYRVRKIDAKTGAISTVAGNGMIRVTDNNGPATTAALGHPGGVAFDLTGNLFIADTGNSLIRKVDPAGIITTVAGNQPLGFSGDNGSAIAADLSTPNALVTDAAGNLFFADSSNQRIRRIDSKGIITTVAGNSQPSYVPGFAGDGDLAVKALLAYPRGAALDIAGNLYIADTENHRVRRVDAKTGIIMTVAGSGPATPEPGGFSGDNGPGFAARLNSPYAVAVDRAGNLLIADSGNGRVRKLDSNGILTTIVGGGSENACDGAATASTIGLGSITGIIADAAGNIFLSDFNNHRILKVDAKGIVTTVAGNNCNAGFSGDSGIATLATFTYPRGIAFDPAGNLFIADTDNHRIRAVHFTGRTGRRRP
jgi:sugar lactone lactonase YvrE